MARRSRETDPQKKLASRPRRGASPQNSRNAGVRLEKGHAKRGGRRMGARNLMSGSLSEPIIAAAEDLAATERVRLACGAT
jgi:hypothetical protein